MGKVTIGNCARNLNLTLRTNCIYTTQHPSYKMRRRKFYGILRYKEIIESDDQTKWEEKKKKKKKKEKKKKENLDLVVPVDHRVKLKESEKRHKYVDLARELKKLWNMKVTVISIVSDALGTVTKGLIQGLEGLDIRGRVDII